MLVSYKWLQSYFSEKLPAPEKVAELFTFHAFEVEGMEKIAPRGGGEISVDAGGDTIFDIKVLPDRAHYALSHRGIAYELAAILGTATSAKKDFPEEMYHATYSVARNDRNGSLAINVEDNRFCPRYIGRIIAGVQVTDSPSWLSERLEAIGQRSINTVVDATNFVMFDCGQPLHAFDAGKVVGDIAVRPAKLGEKITTLDGKEIILPQGTLVIADDVGPLAIAGIKGGARAQVTRETKDVIIEAANFEPTSVRRTSAHIGIRNDSSKRFENGITPDLARTGMDLVTTLLSTLQTGLVVGPLVDVYPLPVQARTIEFLAADISRMLGVAPEGANGLSEREIVSFLARLGIHATQAANAEDGTLVASIPPERLDLTIPADLAEEVGRLYGYEKIPAAALSTLSVPMPVNKRFYWEQKVRAVLASLDFSEVYTHTLADRGAVEIENPLASDKCALRGDLTVGLQKALLLNVRNAPLLGTGSGAETGDIRIFEIGKVFNKESERLSLAVAIGTVKKSQKGALAFEEKMRILKEKLSKALSISIATVDVIKDENGIMEINLDAVIDVLPEPGESEALALSQDFSAFDATRGAKYQKISPYPFVLRDIAVFVPSDLQSGEVESLIVSEAAEMASNNSESAEKSLLVRHALFDVFTKKFPDGTEKTSYAFSLVFQSPDRTLSDDEVSAVMKKIYDAMTACGWQVR